MKRAHASGRLGPRATIKALKAELEQVSKLLDAEVQQNAQLHDRLCLALDGERPPPGVLGTLEALLPFARAAADLADVDATRVVALELALPEGNTRHLFEPPLTVGRFRDAAATVAWSRDGRGGGSTRRGHRDKGRK